MESPSEPAPPASGTDRARITELLSAWSGGDEESFHRLMQLVYDDLKAIAHGRLKSERASHTLRTTALVHEACVRLMGTHQTDWRDRAHFFAMASRVMRHVLVDYARARATEKRGGGRVRVTLTPETAQLKEPVLEVLALEEALRALGTKAPRLERIVECRFFGGMSVPETAAVLDVSERTVERDWKKARGYLYRALDAA